MLAGGLRIGVLRAPKGLHERLATGLRAQSWMVPPLMVDVVCHWINQAAAEKLLNWQTQELAERQQLAGEWLKDFSLSGRSHSSNVWLALPEGSRAVELCERLLQRGVKVSSAEPFCVGSTPAPQAIRLCIGAAADRSELIKALSIIAACLTERPLAPVTL